VTLEATVSPSDAEYDDITWSSSDETVATVDDAGVVHAVGTGTAVITAKAGSKKATCDVSVLINLETPLTFEAAADGATVKFNKYDSDVVATNVEYSLDGGITWKDDLTSDGVTLAAAGDKISFRGTNEAYGADDIYDCYQFELSDETFVYGNVMSLINKDNYPTNKTLTADYAFKWMFNGQDMLKNKDADHQIFLPATTLTENCYDSMFSWCESLTTAPELPAKTLAKECYSGMFWSCKNLTTAPELPATTLAESCYHWMFYDCQKLSSVTCKATNLSADDCLNGWLEDAGIDESVTSKTFYINSAYSAYIAAMNISLEVTADDVQINAKVPWVKGDNGIPAGWTIAAAAAE
jgi:hypothetical protein